MECSIWNTLGAVVWRERGAGPPLGTSGRARKEFGQAGQKTTSSWPSGRGVGKQGQHGFQRGRRRECMRARAGARRQSGGMSARPRALAGPRGMDLLSGLAAQGSLSPGSSKLALLASPHSTEATGYFTMAPTLIEVVDMFREQLFSQLEWHPRPGLLSGRVVVITGASGGLGLETAVHLGKLNPSLVILACRNLQKGKEAKARVLKETGLTEARVEVWPLDLASFASVRVFGERCKAELSRVDVFVQNAGVETYKWGMTEDGWEYNLQVNTLATGLLGVLLLPLLGKTAKLPLEPGMQPFKPHQTIVGSTGKHQLP